MEEKAAIVEDELEANTAAQDVSLPCKDPRRDQEATRMLPREFTHSGASSSADKMSSEH